MVSPPAAVNISEGQSYTGNFGFSDTSAGPWTVTVDYGDGSPISTLSFAAPQASIPLSHAYTTSGTYNLTVTATSTASGQAAKAVEAIAVANVAPTVTIQDAIPTMKLIAGQSHPFQLQAGDSDARFIYQVNWGDGSTEQFVSDSSYLASHTYAAAGSYTIKVTAIDLDGASSTEADLTVTVAPVTIYYPTPVEQEYLERLNDARANPTAYGQSIGIDLSSFQPTMPEAFNLDLMQAAQLHSQDMVNRNYFAHVTPEGLNPQDRAAAAGYTGLVFESIAEGYGVSNPENLLALYVIDAGVSGAGHRIQMIGVDHRDAGVGTVGDVNTVDTGINLNQTEPDLTGVVFNDLNRDGKYYASEGLGGVTITVQGVGSTTTWPSGGYEMALNPGTYTVTASGGGLPAPVTRTVTFTYSNYWQQWNNARLNFTETPVFGTVPNDLASSPGVGDPHWIIPGQTIGYRLQFTNTQTSNPDQQVTIRQPLDPNLDPATFAFGNIRIGSTVVSVPAGSQNFSTVVPLVTANGTAYNLSINATLSAGTVSWTFQALDPATGQTPSDPAVGFLPYLESGEVDWSAAPKAGLATGARIQAGATINFQASGGSNSVSTPRPFNTVDADPSAPTIGIFDPNNAVFHLSNVLNNPGAGDIAFQYGGLGWKPFTGNFSGTGQSTIGVFDPNNAIFHLSDVLGNPGSKDIAFQYGGLGWDPLAGKFFGTSTDTVGVFDPNNAVFHLSNIIGNPANDYAFQYGGTGWIPLAGNFFGTGKDTVAVFDPNNAVFHISNVLGNPGAGDIAFQYGGRGWVPVVGDFFGLGHDTVGVFDPTNGIFHLSNVLGNPGAKDYAFQYGGNGWVPIAGDWDFPTLPQLAAGGEARVPSATAPLTNGQLQTEVQAALNLLAADGVNKGLLAQLGALQFTVGNLPAGYLGLSNLATGQVEISADAAGYGWFVDANPLLDQAFINGVAQPGSAAANRMDLLTVVLHEMGHFDGWTELDPTTHPDALMALTLGTGERRIDALDAVFAAGL